MFFLFFLLFPLNVAHEYTYNLKRVFIKKGGVAYFLSTNQLQVNFEKIFYF